MRKIWLNLETYEKLEAEQEETDGEVLWAFIPLMDAGYPNFIDKENQVVYILGET